MTVLHRGVPIATGDLAVDADFAAGEIDPLPAYAAIQPVVRDAWRAMLNLGYLPPWPGAAGGVDAVGDAAGREALDRAAAVSRALELCDARGGLIPTEWVQVTDCGAGSDVSLMAELSVAEAATPARLRRRPRGNADAAPPAA